MPVFHNALAQESPSSPLADQSWVRLGGPLGGLGYDIRMNPDNPDLMYVTDAFSGVHISQDGGLTWEPSNDGIDVVLSEIYAWSGGSPYSGSPQSILGQLDNNSPNADLTTLLSGNGGGGIAYLNGLCSSFTGVSYCGVFGFYNQVPTYSWDAMVVAHELGHNLSSKHTHACAWNGNNTALDGCGPQAGYTEGCSASIPSNGGTIMSYCHLLGGVGINFNNGFGPQPGTRILNYVNAASCLGNSCTNIGEPAQCNVLSLSDYDIENYAPALQSGTYQITNGGTTLIIQNNAGKSISLNYPVTGGTVIEFEFKSTAQAEVHGIGFDNDNTLSASQIFKLYGTGGNGQLNSDFDNYDGSGYQSYLIPVGEYYSGANLGKLFFVSGNTSGMAGGNGYFRNIRVYEAGQCTEATVTASITTPSENLKTQSADLRIAPNPANTNVQISAVESVEWVAIRLFNLAGALALAANVSGLYAVLDISTLPTGVYTAVCEAVDGRILVDKIVVIRP